MHSSIDVLSYRSAVTERLCMHFAMHNSSFFCTHFFRAQSFATLAVKIAKSAKCHPWFFNIWEMLTLSFARRPLTESTLSSIVIWFKFSYDAWFSLIWRTAFRYSGFLHFSTLEPLFSCFRASLIFVLWWLMVQRGCSVPPFLSRRLW